MTEEIWLALAIAACGVMTFATRASFLVFGKRFRLERQHAEILAFVPASVLAALIAPELFLRDGHMAAVAGNPRLLAAGVAALVAFLSRSVLATIAAGMLALWGVQWL